MPFSPEDFIRKTLENQSIQVIDGGARGGFHLLKRLRPYLNIIASEPDSFAAKELQFQMSRSGFSSYKVLGEGLGKESGEARLFVTVGGEMSSLLKPDPVDFNRQLNRVAGSKEWSQFLEIECEGQVQLRSVKDVARESGWSHIDLLKLDTQGTEFDILNGSRGLLESQSINVICVEVSFVPMYQGQAHFADIDNLLRSCGYRLIDLRAHPDHVRQLNTPSTLKAAMEQNRFLIAADAWYVRSDFGSHRTDAMKSAFVLASVGLFSEASHLIGNELRDDDKTSLFRYLASINNQRVWKAYVKRLIPPAKLDLFKKLKGK